MAFVPNAAPSGDQINQVLEFTWQGMSYEMAERALRAKNNDVNAVVMEFFDDAEKFASKYTQSWDETAFSSSREGDQTSATAQSTPSFIIEPADSSNDNVIWGSEPSNFYGIPPTRPAPSRPPSRANTKSPMSHLVDLTAGEYRPPPNEYGNDAASSAQEEDDIQRAINESLQQSGMQNSQTIPGPPQRPPPSPAQESGVTLAHFGPANKSEYDPNEWAMVQVKAEPVEDPEPAARVRSDGSDVFLRSRGSGRRDRLGSILMVFHSIPAARNALLHLGNPPATGYGSHYEWWKGEPIVLSDEQDEDQRWDQAWKLPPSWAHELHRLVAFLDSTERSYGTADILASIRKPNSPDPESEFFVNLKKACLQAQPIDDAGPGPSAVFLAPIRSSTIHGIEDQQPPVACIPVVDYGSTFHPKSTIYKALDLSVFPESSSHEPHIYRTLKAITRPPQVLTVFFEHPLQERLELSETFYLDRYMERNRADMGDVYFERRVVDNALTNLRSEQNESDEWISPKTGRTCSRTALSNLAIERCRQKIQQIKNRAHWRDHEAARQVPGQDAGFYLPDHAEVANLTAEEAAVVAFYESKLKEAENTVIEVKRIERDILSPVKDALLTGMVRLAELFTVPSKHERWNPTEKYTLRGVISSHNSNTLFIRKRDVDLMQMDDDAEPVEQWWKIRSKPGSTKAVEQKMVSFETVLAETCEETQRPMMIYARDGAMSETPEPLSDALKTFVKFDNRHLKQELSQADQWGNGSEKKRGGSAAAGDSSEAKRRNRSKSIDSMDTNKASLGDLDDDNIRDAPYDLEEDDTWMNAPTSEEHLLDAQDDEARMAPNDHESMGLERTPLSYGASERLARVSLEELRPDGTSGEHVPEMQERGGFIPLITRAGLRTPTINPTLLRSREGGSPASDGSG
ncbi:hypothetical protein B0T19DRAFT_442309 [Cercophora scortea]|uniref:UBA domain-containing protein n=1 Tax=Cercophora scortea TaxID=314031 RepID=A0AAE0INE3_9PEZI|nr:hypothetical protein B0T19DRAFT_442309 [Cercophora scortea]